MRSVSRTTGWWPVKSAIAVPAVLVALGLSAAHVVACECVGSSTPTQALDQSAAVFSGQVVAISHGTRWVDAKAKRPADCFLMGTFDEAGIALCEDEDVLV